MKISLNWLFDHIIGDVQKISMTDLVERFIKTTAEIEGWKSVVLSVEQLTLVQVVSVADDCIRAFSPELKKEYTVPFRSDVSVGLWYLVDCNNNHAAAWSTIKSLGGTKDTLLPALTVKKELQAGEWKKFVEISDYIIDIDNKSINHRPDLWGHRGIAREIAAIFDLSLVPLDQMIVQKNIVRNPLSLQAQAGPFAIAIESPAACKNFTACSIESIVSQPSSLDMVIRLSRIDSRSIDFIVDCTNYVMFDLGHPMHAFDAATLPEKNIIIRYAKNEDKITLLDGQAIQLTSNDIIIADGDQPISLAGIMGGLTTGVTSNTKSLLLEVAHFDSTTIRRTAARYKKRTEASTRFEKNLDPYRTADMIQRFLFLLDKNCVIYKSPDALISIGKDFTPLAISVKHLFIEQRLGLRVTSEKVQAILEKLDFLVEQTVDDNDLSYAITAPSFRATKDIKIAEDIVEEIGRYIGYDSIDRIMPALHKEPADLNKVYVVRTLKHLLSSGLLMRELYGYSFFDETFVRKIGWDPEEFVEIKNPISENYTRLVTTLQPHLLKAVEENSIHHKQLRFYEWGRVWRLEDGSMSEKKSLSGIFFEDSSRAADFYDGKNLLMRLFQELSMTVVWRKPTKQLYPWLSMHQTAELVCEGVCIGLAGVVEQSVVQSLFAASGNAFIFELDGDYIVNYKKPLVTFSSLSKYPSVLRDISIMVPLASTVDEIVDTIKKVDHRIQSVTLIDFFTKAEWNNQKAVTFHIEIRDNDKTLESDEVESLWGMIIKCLQSDGAVIR